MPIELASTQEMMTLGMQARHAFTEPSRIIGQFGMQCHRDDGKLLWEVDFPNVIFDAAVRLILDTMLGAVAGYAVVGPFMGLIGATTLVAPTINPATDTMASHPGWLEVGGANQPTTLGTTRGTVAWSAAAVRTKTMTPAQTFTMSASVTVGSYVTGAFLVFHTAASVNKDSTTGTIYSAGAFLPGQPVASNNVLTVNYSTGLT